MEYMHKGAVYEDLQPAGRTHRAVCGGLSVMGYSGLIVAWAESSSRKVRYANSCHLFNHREACIEVPFHFPFYFLCTVTPDSSDIPHLISSCESLSVAVSSVCSIVCISVLLDEG